jgi:DNA polymerase III subunit beta
MKFIVDRTLFIEKLGLAAGPTTTKQNFPILNSVFIASSQNKLKITTTDLDVTIITSLEANILKEGQTAIPMKRLMSIIKEMPTGEITIELTKNNLLIKCEKIEFRIAVLDEQEFPKIEEAKKASLIKLNPETLEEMLRATIYCAGYEDTNYVLNGILFELEENKIKLIATDGKRLAVIKKPLPAAQPSIEEKISFILPIKAVNELSKLIKDYEEDVFLFVEENRVGFDFKGTQFIARPVEGEFPAYSQYIPAEGKEKMIVVRENLLAALRRADLLSTPDYQGVKMEIKKDALSVSKTTPQLGEAKETLDVKYNGGSLNIGFNPGYLMDVLRNLSDDEVVFEFFGPDKPAVLRKEDYVYLVLPMKT